MLWINGYTSPLSQRLMLSEKEGSAFWGSFTSKAAKLLSDWNSVFIHPASSLLSNPAHRFTAGYRFAEEHYRKLKEHIMLGGNACQMIAFGHGVAFAEGMAAFLYEEKNISTELAIFIQGSGMQLIPQSRAAIDCRVVYNTSFNEGGRGDQYLPKVTDVIINETRLKGGFCKYGISVNSQLGELVKDHLYLRGKINLRTYRKPHLYREFQLVTVLRHALNLYKDVKAEAMVSSGDADLQNHSLRQYLLNHN